MVTQNSKAKSLSRAMLLHVAGGSIFASPGITAPIMRLYTLEPDPDAINANHLTIGLHGYNPQSVPLTVTHTRPANTPAGLVGDTYAYNTLPVVFGPATSNWSNIDWWALVSPDSLASPTVMYYKGNFPGAALVIQTNDEVRIAAETLILIED